MQIAELDKELSGLQAKLFEAKKQGSQLSDNAAEASTTIANLQQQLTELQHRCARDERRVRELEQALWEAQAAQQSDSSRCATLGRDLTAAKGQIEALSQKVQRIKVRLATVDCLQCWL
jgi:chromosome segregation ATPase